MVLGLIEGWDNSSLVCVGSSAFVRNAVVFDIIVKFSFSFFISLPFPFVGSPLDREGVWRIVLPPFAVFFLSFLFFWAKAFLLSD